MLCPKTACRVMYKQINFSGLAESKEMLECFYLPIFCVEKALACFFRLGRYFKLEFHFLQILTEIFLLHANQLRS